MFEPAPAPHEAAQLKPHCVLARGSGAVACLLSAHASIYAMWGALIVTLLPHLFKVYTNLIMRRMVKILQRIGQRNARSGWTGGDINRGKTVGAGLGGA